jgi:hypothetical protein
LEHDYEIEQRFSERGQYRSVMFISCKGLVSRREMMRGLQEMMQTIQKEYGQPVDIEFTLNLSENREYMINLLQCRPLQAFEDTGEVLLPKSLPEESLLLHSEGASMGLSRALSLDFIVYVDPISYYKLPYAQKDTVAKAIGRINWRYRGSGKHMMLIVPGRVGTTSPELGVPTTFADISEFEVICELSVSGVGYNPELSYGSHIFQDLVEAGILYTAVFEDEHTKVYHPEKLLEVPNLFLEMLPDADDLQSVVRICDVSGGRCILYNDLSHEQLYVVMSHDD